MLSQSEFDAILSDTSKYVAGSIRWQDDEDHSPALEFSAEIQSDSGYPLVVKGRVNLEARTLSFSVIHRGVGRIYGLDLGKDHQNPSGQIVGEKHKHSWKESVRDKEAYVPADITEPITNVAGVWRQFCQEFSMTHHGALATPGGSQGQLFS